jgi:Rhodopirellula transposase DDE domain
MIRAAQERAVRKRYKQMAPALDEQSRRRGFGSSRVGPRWGSGLLARITGLARRTNYRGIADIRNKCSREPGRVRKTGGGRKQRKEKDPTLLTDRKSLVEPTTRGGPMKALLWTSKSLRKLAIELKKKGHAISPTVVGNLLHEMDYSLQSNSKTIEGDEHIDRDDQFQYINNQAKMFLVANTNVSR